MKHNNFRRNAITLIVILCTMYNVQSQNTPFSVTIEPLNISNLGGIQSYAVGQSNGKWLIVGGRLDGLHRRQPWAAFDVAGNNNQLIVVDPVNQQTWSTSLSSLPTPIQEQLSSTNMEFYQEGDYLYFLGGYGFSATANDHITYPNLTAIKVPDVINGIINQTSITSYFRQITDTLFEVTGGRLKKINNNYHLLGGQKFIGRYNPNGPNNGSGFIQEYTNSIRIFTINDDGTNITINHIQQHIDTVNLHRRDYNAGQQIMPNEEEGITMFSGVFQQNADLPFLNCVNVDSSGYVVNNSFQQYYNHYHCPVLPIYSATNNEMHTVFFGGIAQYYDSNGTLVQDDNVPFVNTIARVTRNSAGVMTEYKLPITMPALLGSGAEFIPNLTIPHYNNEVFKLDSLTDGDTVLIGYIYGGISSTAPNIFFINDGTQSSASSQIFKVFITKGDVLSIDELNVNSTNSLNMTVYPNPANQNITVNYNLKKSSNVKISIFDIQGKLITLVKLNNIGSGEHSEKINIENLTNKSIYIIQVETEYERFIEKIIIED